MLPRWLPRLRRLPTATVAVRPTTCRAGYNAVCGMYTAPHSISSSATMHTRSTPRDYWDWLALLDYPSTAPPHATVIDQRGQSRRLTPAAVSVWQNRVCTFYTLRDAKTGGCPPPSHSLMAPVSGTAR